MACSPVQSLPDMAARPPPFYVQPGLQANMGQGGSRCGTAGSLPRGILKSTSLPALDRPGSSLVMMSGGLPPGAAQFQRSAEYRPGMNGLPTVSEFNRPGTSQCNSWLESSMGFRMGCGPPPPRAGGSLGAPPNSMNMTAISVQSTPKSAATVGFMNEPSTSRGLEQWPARTAARARMGSLKHFTATPPRPVSRERREPLPALTFMGMCGGQVRHAEDWHYKTHGYTRDKRMRHDHIAGDLGYS